MSCLKLLSNLRLEKLVGIYNCKTSFSTASILQNKRFKTRWITSEKWKKVEVNGEMKTWMPNVPLTKVENEFTRDKAYFGMYDFLAVLGNDVTLTPKLFCKGPGYVRATNHRELFMLLKKRRMLGHHMHAEDLHTIQRRIKHLMKIENRVKKSRDC